MEEHGYSEENAYSQLEELGVPYENAENLVNICFGDCSGQKGMPEVLERAIQKYNSDRDFAGKAGSWVFAPERAHRHIYQNIEEGRVKNMHLSLFSRQTHERFPGSR